MGRAAGAVPTHNLPDDLADRVRHVVDDVVDRRGRGEPLDDRQVVAAHPDLMPLLGEELAALDQIRRARLAAARAGPIVSPRGGAAAPADAGDDTDADASEPAGEGGTDPRTGGVDPHVSICGYRIVCEIGGGGQATVYRAVQEATGRVVAIKVMPGGPFLNSRRRARFDREAAVLAGLDHPNVIGILDRGRTADGSFFLVMPLVDGPALDEHLFGPDGRSLPAPRRVAALMAKVADAVDEAHRRGVVHRDLKPSNVRVDRRGEPCVLDFGLAHLVDPPGGDAAVGRRHDARLTVTGQIVGSLPWASPEQAKGTGDAGLGVRSDVYALGVMLYQGLTGGRFPYDVDGPVSEVLGNILTAEPPAPSRVARDGGLSIDPALDAIVLRALAKDPGARHASAGDLARELTAYLDGRATPPPPAAPGPFPCAYRANSDACDLSSSSSSSPSSSTAGRPRRRRTGRPLWTAAATGALLLLLTAGPAAWYARPVRPRDADRPPTVFDLPTVTNAVGMRLIRIPGGTFLMGSPPGEDGREVCETQREVRVTAFALSATEVTRRQWAAVMGTEPFPDAESSDGDDGDVPADGLSWHDAVAFCEELSRRERQAYRLPSEAEWEYACRAGSTRAVAGSGVLERMGWCGAVGSRGTLHPVAAKWPNHWGLYDMHGNAEEWCQDAFGPSPATGDGGRAIHRAVRGGGAHSPADRCRAAARDGLDPNERHAGVGFRVVLVPEPDARPRAPAPP